MREALERKGVNGSQLEARRVGSTFFGNKILVLTFANKQNKLDKERKEEK